MTSYHPCNSIFVIRNFNMMNVNIQSFLSSIYTVISIVMASITESCQKRENKTQQIQEI